MSLSKFHKLGRLCYAESLIQNGQYNIVDSDPFPFPFSEKYLLISYVTWATQRDLYIAVGVRYGRLDNGVMHTNYVCVLSIRDLIAVEYSLCHHKNQETLLYYCTNHCVMVSEAIMVRLFLNFHLSSEFFISLVILYCP